MEGSIRHHAALLVAFGFWLLLETFSLGDGETFSEALEKSVFCSAISSLGLLSGWAVLYLDLAGILIAAAALWAVWVTVVLATSAGESSWAAHALWSLGWCVLGTFVGPLAAVTIT